MRGLCACTRGVCDVRLCVLLLCYCAGVVHGRGSFYGSVHVFRVLRVMGGSMGLCVSVLV